MAMAKPSTIPLDERGVLAVGGAEARDFLQGLVTNDMAKAGPRRALFAALLTPQGKFLFDFIVLDDGRGGILLDTARDRLPELARRLALYRLRRRVTIEDVSATLGVSALIGDGAAEAVGLESAAGSARRDGTSIACVDPRLAALGVRLVHPAEEPPHLDGIGAGTPDDYHAHRLALAVPEGGRDVLVDKSFILESNFEELNGVDFDKGCYVGQELTARTKFRGKIRRRLHGVTARTALPPPGTPITAGGAAIGEMRGAMAGRGIALIRTDRLQAAGPEAEIMAGGVGVVPIKPDWAAF